MELLLKVIVCFTMTTIVCWKHSQGCVAFLQRIKGCYEVVLVGLVGGWVVWGGGGSINGLLWGGQRTQKAWQLKVRSIALRQEALWGMAMSVRNLPHLTGPVNLPAIINLSPVKYKDCKSQLELAPSGGPLSVSHTPWLMAFCKQGAQQPPTGPPLCYSITDKIYLWAVQQRFK